eukprot:5137443-Amphidinium_carterae.4
MHLQDSRAGAAIGACRPSALFVRPLCLHGRSRALERPTEHSYLKNANSSNFEDCDYSSNGPTFEESTRETTSATSVHTINMITHFYNVTVDAQQFVSLPKGRQLRQQRGNL